MSKRNKPVECVDDVQYHPNSDTYRTSFPDDQAATTAVVSTLAEIRHCDPIDIEPLYEVVDTDALDRLVESVADPLVQINFVVEGFEVTVYGDNTLEVVPPI